MVFSNLIPVFRKIVLTFNPKQLENTKFNIVYQDHFIKFVIHKSLTSKRAEEITGNLVKIFSLFGGSSKLHFDNGRETDKNVVTSLKEFRSALKIVHGKPHHSRSRVKGSAERVN